MNLPLQPIDYDERALSCHYLLARLINLSEMRGIEPNRLLKGTKLFDQDLATEKGYISAKDIFKVFDNIERINSLHDLSFLAGRHLFNEKSVTTKSVLTRSNSLSDLLRLIADDQITLCPLVTVSIHRNNGQIHLLFSPAFGVTPTQYRFLCELIAAAIIGVLKNTLSINQLPDFRFPYARPLYIEQYQMHLGSNAQFDQHMFLVSFPHVYWHQPFNPQRSTSLSLKHNKIQRVGLSRAVQQSLLKSPQKTLQDVAQELAISSATLKRKLKQNNTSFQQLQDQRNLQQAVYQLLIVGNSNADIANQLKIYDINNFRRAFKRWTGATPAQFRNSHSSC